jgi:hypothetical protein
MTFHKGPKEGPGMGPTVFIKELPEGLARWICYTLYHCVQRHLGGADGPHAVMDPPWSQTPLDYLLGVNEGLECTRT